jgi:mono/diheme cytochrome c family protein
MSIPRWRLRALRSFGWLALVAALLPGSARAQPAVAGTAVTRGEYVFHASGGCRCHTDAKHQGAPLAGGRSIETPFGTLYSTNITPDRETGIGSWDDADFLRAMREGTGPGGQHFFPVFPYTSFTRMTDRDLRELKAYLFSLKPVAQPNRPPEMIPPFGWRFPLRFWKWLNLDVGVLAPDPTRSAEWNRGRYLAEAVAHCGECHTPRNLMGAMRPAMLDAGSAEGPEGELAPNVTPDRETGIGKWSERDLVYFLETGIKADGDDVQGLMAEVIDHGYKYMTGEDRKAIAVYVQSLPPIRNKVVAKPKPKPAK